MHRLSDTVTVDDVVEAARLIKEAIKASATDPRTGRIDIDLLTSGESSAARRVFADMKHAFRSMLMQRDASTLPFNVAVAEFARQCDMV